MSLLDYEHSIDLYKYNYSFASLIMAAMRKADDENMAKLVAAWTDIFIELQQRYNAPGGRLKSDNVLVRREK
jgi:hypothetical protein